jgi:hypothetical protein
MKGGSHAILLEEVGWSERLHEVILNLLLDRRGYLLMELMEIWVKTLLIVEHRLSTETSSVDVAPITSSSREVDLVGFCLLRWVIFNALKPWYLQIFFRVVSAYSQVVTLLCNSFEV